MLHIELKKRIPQHRHEVSLHGVEGLYALCRTLFDSGDEIQCYFGPANPDDRNPNPLHGTLVSFHYLPNEQYLRIQMFENGNSQLPLASIVCWPDEIHEMGTYGSETFHKIYRPYLGVIDGKLEWKMVRSDAPRTLTYLNREMIPVFRNEFIHSLTEMIRHELSRAVNATTDIKTCEMITSRMQYLQEFLFVAAKIPGYTHNQFSPDFINNLRDNYVFITSFLRKVHNPNWSPEEEGKWLKRFFRALDPRTDVNGSVESDLIEQWNTYVSQQIRTKLDGLRQKHITTTEMIEEMVKHLGGWGKL